jgi:hypothetical protein
MNTPTQPVVLGLRPRIAVVWSPDRHVPMNVVAKMITAVSPGWLEVPGVSCSRCLWPVCMPRTAHHEAHLALLESLINVS